MYVPDLPLFYSLQLILITLVDQIDGCRDLAASMNPSFSTLRLLRVVVSVHMDIQDPLSGICDEFAAISGHNVIEELDLEILVCRGHSCEIPDHWGGRLDDVLAIGFPRLGQVSLRVLIYHTASVNSDYIFMDKLKKLQFPWLSKNSIVKLNFSVKLKLLS